MTPPSNFVRPFTLNPTKERLHEILQRRQDPAKGSPVFVRALVRRLARPGPERRCTMTVNTAAVPPPKSKRWTHYINDDFFDHPDMGGGLELLVLRLERLARDKAWLNTTNEQLRAILGCSRNTLAELLKRGEELGWFRRVLITGKNGRATGRLGIVLFRRPTDRPVATHETYDQIVAQMMAANQRGQAQPRTLPFPPPAPQNSGAAVPKNWAPPVPKNWAPSSYKEKTSGEETKKTTTMTGDSHSETPTDIHARFESSSSSFAALPRKTEIPTDPLPAVPSLDSIIGPTLQSIDASNYSSVEPGPPAVPQPTRPCRAERPVPAAVPSPPTAVHPAAETIELTPTVPALVPSTEGIDQALLAALVSRVVRLSAGFKVGPNWTPEAARTAILGLLRSFGCPLWWIANAWTRPRVVHEPSWATRRWKAGGSSGRSCPTGHMATARRGAPPERSRRPRRPPPALLRRRAIDRRARRRHSPTVDRPSPR